MISTGAAAPTVERGTASDGGLCLLSLDGGGVKGLSSLFILKRLMDQFNHERERDGNRPPLKPCDVFHLIGGTSTGGLIAVMLGRLGLTVDECIEQYSTLIEQVFKKKIHRLPINLKFKVNPRFSSDVLQKAIEGVLSERELRADTPLLEESPSSPCKVFVCATAKETTQVRLFKTYQVGGDRDYLKPTLVQAALATSAATSFFRECKIGARAFLDGAFQANNPAFQVKQEAMEIWCSEGEESFASRVRCFISIGTGHPGLDSLGDTPTKLIESLTKLATKTEEIAETFGREWPSLYNKRYFRFNVDHGMEKVGLEEYAQRPLIEAAADAYLNKLNQKNQVKACVQALLNEIETTKALPEVQVKPEEPADFRVPVQLEQEFAVKPGQFIERTRLLSSLEAKLLPTPRLPKAIVNLWGLAGSGKTQLAHHFVRRHRNEYTACFKAHGRSEQEFRSSLAGLATNIPAVSLPPARKDEPDGIASEELSASQEMQQWCVAAVCDWLNAKGNSNWLLMIDNVEAETFAQPISEFGNINVRSSLSSEEYLPETESSDGEASESEKSSLDENDRGTHSSKLYLQRYLDQLCQGTIILTSQHSLVSDIYPGIEVAELDEQESFSLMKRTLNSDDLPEAESLRLAQILGNHVQAVDSAAIYMKHFKHVDVQTYIKQWEDCDAKIFKQEADLENKALFTTLKLAFDKLDKKTQRFLNICSFLDPTFIWAGLFTVEADGELENYLPSDVLFDQMIRQIGSLLLISPSLMGGDVVHKNGISIHPVLHKIIQRMSINQGLAEDCINLAINLIGSVVPSQYDTDYPDTSRILLLHAEQCRRNFQIFDRLGLELDQLTLANVGNLGKLFQENGQFDYAIELYDRALMRYDSLKVHSEEYYHIVNSRGLASLAVGDLRKAQKCFSILQKHAEKASAPEHLKFSILEVITNYGITLRNQRDLKGAEKQFLDALKGYKAQSKVHHARIQMYRIKQYLGSTYALQGDLRKAARLVHEARVGLESALEGDSIYVFLAAQELASIYQRLDSLEAAAEQLQFARSGLERLCGPRSQYILENRWHRIMLDFSLCRRQQGDPQPVCEDFEKLIAEQESNLGRNHWLTLRSIRTYGQALEKIGRWQEAEQRFRTALARYDFPGTKQDVWGRSSAAVSLAKNVWVQADGEGILELYEEALELYEEVADVFLSSHTAYAAEQFRQIVLCKANIICKIGSEEEQREILTQVLALPGIDELHRGWAQDNLHRIMSGGATVEDAGINGEEDFEGITIEI